MLVLSRKQEQRIQIGENVTITILQIKGRSVRIGIDAPDQMHIVRSEIRDDDADEASAPPEQPAIRRRDRVRAHRSPAFGRRRMASVVGDRPLRRHLDKRDRSEQQAALSPTRCPDEQRSLGSLRRERGSLGRELGCEAIIDRPQIDLHLDPYQQGPAPRLGRPTRYGDVDDSPVLRALRWRA